LDHGANLEIRNRKDQTPLHNIIQRLQKQNSRDFKFKALLLLYYGAKPYRSDRKILRTLPQNNELLWASILGDQQRVAAIVKEQFEQPDNSLKHRLSVLGYVAKVCWNPCIKFINEIIQDPDNRIQVTPLHWAAAQGKHDIVRILLKYIDCNSQDQDGNSPADIAVRNGHMLCAQLLFAAGARLNRQRVLHAAIRRHDKKLIEQLLSQQDMHVNEQDLDGNTPLHIAAGQPGMPWVLTLLSSGARINKLNRHKQSPLHLMLLSQNLKDLNQIITDNMMPKALSILGKSQFAPIAAVGQIPELCHHISEFIVADFFEHLSASKFKPYELGKIFNALRVPLKPETQACNN
ncbi:MAG TPA: ankyrin repeat domain-containing protein, partial [Candidatus Babeliaceae bacterium]|nr:ankyrin repeat domain-containing protein [Candidatus Babeliaceae bacterium]